MVQPQGNLQMIASLIGIVTAASQETAPESQA